MKKCTSHPPANHRKGIDSIPVKSPWFKAGVLYFGVCVLYMNIYYVPPLTVTLMRDIGITHFQVGVLSTSFMIAFSISNIIIGLVSVRINQKKIMVWGLLFGFFCSLLFAFSPPSPLVILFLLRAGLGVSTACMIAPCLLYLLSILPQKSALAISIHLASITLGLGMAFLITPPLAEIISWRHIVILFASLIGVAFLLTLMAIGTPPSRKMNRRYGMNPSYSGLAVLFGILFVIFIQIGANNIWLTPWLEENFLFSSAEIGFASMMFQMMGIPTSILGGYLYGKTRNLLYLGSLGMILSTINAAYSILEGSRSFGVVLLIILLSRSGAFLCVGPLMSMVPKFVHADSKGLTLGMAHTICAIGIIVSSFVGGVIIEYTGEYHLLWTLTAICLVCGACILNPVFTRKWLS